MRGAPVRASSQRGHMSLTKAAPNTPMRGRLLHGPDREERWPQEGPVPARTPPAGGTWGPSAWPAAGSSYASAGAGDGPTLEAAAVAVAAASLERAEVAASSPSGGRSHGHVSGRGSAARSCTPARETCRGGDDACTAEGAGGAGAGAAAAEEARASPLPPPLPAPPPSPSSASRDSTQSLASSGSPSPQDVATAADGEGHAATARDTATSAASPVSKKSGPAARTSCCSRS